MKIGTLMEELSQFNYDDNLQFYFLKNNELKSCNFESILDANYKGEDGYTTIELTIQDSSEDTNE